MTIRQFSPRTTEEIAAVIRDYRQRRSRETGADDGTSQPWGAQIVHWVRTTTTTDFPTYPADPANTFIVEFGDLEYNDAIVGYQAATFTPYADPQETQIAFSPCGWLAHGSVRRASLHHGRWYLFNDCQPAVTSSSSVSSSSISSSSSSQSASPSSASQSSSSSSCTPNQCGTCIAEWDGANWNDISGTCNTVIESCIVGGCPTASEPDGAFVGQTIVLCCLEGSISSGQSL